MDIVFDAALIEQNRKRALRSRDDKALFLLDIAAEEIADRIAIVERHFDTAVELHGATGITAQRIKETGKVGTVTRVDIDAAFATNNEPLEIAPIEHLPLAPASANLIVSPLSLHLTNDTPGTLIQIRRALKPDGLFMAAIPGAGTLQELRDVLLSTEAELSGGASPRVIPFADVRDVGALLQRAGFALPVTDTETYTVRYDSILPLMRDLRAMGMSNPLAGRSRKPLNRRFFMRAAELYAEKYSDPDGRIRATFSIIYVSGWAPHESQQKPLKPGSAKVRLADALKTAEIKLPSKDE
ncbi:methyltransferase domain-containing protein [Agrobacterium rubi]|uniref:methyltransferase domain-containing protein n=1 Tax=Agrobacterium rubi TaxID=28099 RepID=UPI001573FBE0|nr:methyltransferase domain-containing protein [Agrobacterium rubi]NTF09360.1 methyltransferase domain-containing protein [Agrobacterium rubi]NTF22267.1 methyltransferase domain-containing protein [Agrobacterium rubi]NTF29124.1 methyltransferase domain-containing protein [Agrobacterium rubi]